MDNNISQQKLHSPETHTPPNIFHSVMLTGTEWELGVVQGTDGGDVGGSNTDPLSKAKGDSESSEATA
ncbi:hypothetical protein PGT21_032841 [Puccinia graminis f. sp. tritici]|uniref:Uncharacterized protein n=1 Tax=Puccinia graminis f. sp. tritici TaxID=56615 RepID=A0A5B0LKT1_PUCGR|nr:hypothetical protein PGTUg99_006027 [Puccinia graminis f. sp. tritici]KAA1094921.1 hypothetical protein PGT21_032841 [Puccinia graminis f. sp. tritici]